MLARSTFICVYTCACAKIFDLLVIVGFHALGSTLRLFRVKLELILEVVQLRNKVRLFVLKTLQLRRSGGFRGIHRGLCLLKQEFKLGDACVAHAYSLVEIFERLQLRFHFKHLVIERANRLVGRRRPAACLDELGGRKRFYECDMTLVQPSCAQDAAHPGPMQSCAL